ncbi:hypothetical protein Tco_1008931 [Tanacetum coccineum]
MIFAVYSKIFLAFTLVKKKQKRLKKNVDYEQLIDVLAMDKSMLKEELSATKSKLKLYDSFGINANVRCYDVNGYVCNVNCFVVNVWNASENGMPMQNANVHDMQMRMQYANGMQMQMFMFVQFANEMLYHVWYVHGMISRNDHQLGLLTMSVWGDDKEALAFEEDDPDALAFETDEKEGLAFEANNLEALVFLPPNLENMYSGMSLSVKSSYHCSKRLDGPLLDTMFGEVNLNHGFLEVDSKGGIPNEDDHEEANEACLMVVGSQKARRNHHPQPDSWNANITNNEDVLESSTLYGKFSEQNDAMKGTSTNTKFAKPSILGKSPLQSFRNQSVVRQPTAFQSVRSKSSKTWFIRKVVETIDLTKPVTSHSVPKTQESKVVNNEKVIAPGMFRINPLKNSREDNFVPNKQVKASVRTKPITVSQPHVITKQDVNSNSSLSSTRVKSTTETRRP